MHESDLASLEFNPKLWNIAVDHAVIRKTGTIAFHLINGMEITA